MRIPGMLVAGVLALSAPVSTHAVPLGSNTGPATTGPAPGIVKAWGGCGWGWHPIPGHWSPWGAWVSTALRAGPLWGVGSLCGVGRSLQCL